jgi:hypothetical protein
VARTRGVIDHRIGVDVHGEHLEHDRAVCRRAQVAC